MCACVTRSGIRSNATILTSREIVFSAVFFWDSQAWLRLAGIVVNRSLDDGSFG